MYRAVAGNTIWIGLLADIVIFCGPDMRTRLGTTPVVAPTMCSVPLHLNTFRIHVCVRCTRFYEALLDPLLPRRRDNRRDFIPGA